MAAPRPPGPSPRGQRRAPHRLASRSLARAPRLTSGSRPRLPRQPQLQPDEQWQEAAVASEAPTFCGSPAAGGLTKRAGRGRERASERGRERAGSPGARPPAFPRRAEAGEARGPPAPLPPGSPQHCSKFLLGRSGGKEEAGPAARQRIG